MRITLAQTDVHFIKYIAISVKQKRVLSIRYLHNQKRDINFKTKHFYFMFIK